MQRPKASSYRETRKWLCHGYLNGNQELFHKGTNQLIYGTLTWKKKFFCTDRKNW